ncbi:hypothetical protein OsJ_33526 [Oryza sativa Japonica Group]|uniref:Uncharacterized protein n=2 Tax=Oryza sativa subsp. japonica TaxID=39947 RepID=A0A9K3Y6X8_ORYSJ|nr:hypothetical protein LOC_Os11g14210 [Oryza sativa Japonica Group]ABA92351.1 hypothetical protein LOC_Os11g14210 [Oryza sativa Japonica Group]EAZ17980.1 hypothetical protein OsJ_33526 [Oryza sativa Japonica Group]
MALGGRSAKGPVGSGSSGDAKEIMDEEVGVAKAEVDQWVRQGSLETTTCFSSTWREEGGRKCRLVTSIVTLATGQLSHTTNARGEL